MGFSAYSLSSRRRRRHGGGIAAIVEGDRLPRLYARSQQPQRQGHERYAELHAGLACSSASTRASTRIGLVT